MAPTLIPGARESQSPFNKSPIASARAPSNLSQLLKAPTQDIDGPSPKRKRAAPLSRIEPTDNRPKRDYFAKKGAEDLAWVKEFKSQLDEQKKGIKEYKNKCRPRGIFAV